MSGDSIVGPGASSLAPSLQSPAVPAAPAAATPTSSGRPPLLPLTRSYTIATSAATATAPAIPPAASPLPATAAPAPPSASAGNMAAPLFLPPAPPLRAATMTAHFGMTTLQSPFDRDPRSAAPLTPSPSSSHSYAYGYGSGHGHNHGHGHGLGHGQAHANSYGYGYGHGQSPVSVLIRNLPDTTTEESLRIMFVWSDQLLEAELLPMDHPLLGDRRRHRSAILTFRSAAGAHDAKKMYNGKPNLSSDAEMAVDILPSTRPDDGSRMYGSGNNNRNRPGSHDSHGSASSPSSRSMARFAISGFTSLDRISPPLVGGAAGNSGPFSGPDLPGLFSPQSPIGAHLERSRNIGKALITTEAAAEDDDGDPGELLKQSVPCDEHEHLHSEREDREGEHNHDGDGDDDYDDDDGDDDGDDGIPPAAIQRRATAPQLPITRMAGLSLNTSHAMITSSLPHNNNNYHHLNSNNNSNSNNYNNNTDGGGSNNSSGSNKNSNNRHHRQHQRRHQHRNDHQNGNSRNNSNSNNNNNHHHHYMGPGSAHPASAGPAGSITPTAMSPVHLGSPGPASTQMPPFSLSPQNLPPLAGYVPSMPLMPPPGLPVPGLAPSLPTINPADQNPPCNTLYVGNLPLDTSEEELKAMFSRQRGYKRLCFRSKTNGPMCFVEFEDVSYATKALNDLYGHPLHNSVKGGIRLSFSKNPLGVRPGQMLMMMYGSPPPFGHSAGIGPAGLAGPGSPSAGPPAAGAYGDGSMLGPAGGGGSTGGGSDSSSSSSSSMAGFPGFIPAAGGPPPGLSAPPGLGMNMNSGRVNYGMPMPMSMSSMMMMMMPPPSSTAGPAPPPPHHYGPSPGPYPGPSPVGGGTWGPPPLGYGAGTPANTPMTPSAPSHQSGFPVLPPHMLGSSR